jgi:hypothetical protein
MFHVKHWRRRQCTGFDGRKSATTPAKRVPARSRQAACPEPAEGGLRAALKDPNARKAQSIEKNVSPETFLIDPAI